MVFSCRQNVPLAPLTTLGLGGNARFFVDVTGVDGTVEALRWAAEKRLPVFVMGGGSNVVVGDDGFDGLVIQMGLRGLSLHPRGKTVLVEAAAGEPWDAVVALTVARDLSGLECLSGIPGLVGATPIQNVGAYGQDVSQVLRSVRVLDRDSLVIETLDADACELAYRDSFFKRQPHRFLILSVTFELTPGGAPKLSYAELQNALAMQPATAPSLTAVRDMVLTLRRKKSMVIDPADPNRRSAGSFFTNPVVTAKEADRVAAVAVAQGLVARTDLVPRFAAPGRQVKLSAGWLIEMSGISKGFRQGAVGVSTNHALALVHHGGGSTADLLQLARHIRTTVHDRFGVLFAPEPVIVGAIF